MDELIRDTLAYLKQEHKSTDFVIASPEEWAYFQNAPQPLALDPPKKPKADGMEELRMVMSKVAPSLKLKNDIPDDAIAKKIASHWQEELKTTYVALLSFGETGSSLQFLQNIALAISAHFSGAKVVDGSRFEKEKKWSLFFDASPLKLVLAPPSWKNTSIVSFYRQNPIEDAHFLGKTPFLILEPIPNYFKDPSSKLRLWKTIVSHLSS